MYRQLDAGRIVSTAHVLQARVAERFPASGLAEIARELVTLAENTSQVASSLAAPHRAVRAAAALGLLLLLLTAGAAVWLLDLRMTAFSSLSDLVQGVEALVSDVVFLGVAAFFLLSWETRLKRSKALTLARELRAMAHIVDLHQLMKDPQQLHEPDADTDASVSQPLSPLQLTSYLNYSSELLSLISKLAALLVQGFDDPVTLAAVNDIEDLTGGISRKLWQKITLIDRLLPPFVPTPGPGSGREEHA